MSAPTKRQVSREEGLLDMGVAAIEMALEDGGTREFVCETVGLPVIEDYATTEHVARVAGLYADDMGAGSIVVKFADGSQWQISVSARRVK